MKSFKQQDMFIRGSNFPIANALADMIPCWHNFVTKMLPDAKVLNCMTHKMAIPFKKHRFLRRFTGPMALRDAERYHVLFQRMTRNPFPALKQLLFDKMYDLLMAMKQPLAAEKFRKNDAADRKCNFMICDCGYGTVNHNNAQEGHQKEVKIATQGLSGPKQHSGAFTAMICKFVGDFSDEHFRRLKDSREGLGTFESQPVPEKCHYDIIQNMHCKTLLGIFCTGSTVSGSFHYAMQTVTELGNKDTPVYLKIRMAHEQGLDFFNRKGSLYTGRSYLIPSQKLLNSVDPTGDMPRNAFYREMTKARELYQSLVPVGTGEARSWDLPSILDVLESFHTVHALKADERWGDILGKCSCAACHKDCVCQHTVLLTLLGNRGMTIPQAYIAATMEDRKKRGRRFLGQDALAEEEEEPEETGAWHATIGYDSEQEKEIQAIDALSSSQASSEKRKKRPRTPAPSTVVPVSELLMYKSSPAPSRAVRRRVPGS